MRVLPTFVEVTAAFQRGAAILATTKFMFAVDPQLAVATSRLRQACSQQLLRFLDGIVVDPQ